MLIEKRQVNDFYSNSEVWVVRSDAVGDRFRVCITAPEWPLDFEQRVGAVYAVDADILAGSVAGATRQMLLGNDLPPLFAISVGYPLDHPVTHLVQRNRDLAPTPLPDFDPMLPAIFGGPVVVSGAASAFRAFLLEELRPALEAAFPLNPNSALLAGASLGGLFVLDTLLECPTAFDRWLAISPAVWWDAHRALKRAKSSAPLTASAATQVYLCAGEFESQAHIQAIHRSLPREALEAIPAFVREVDMIEDMHLMTAALRRLLPQGSRVNEAVMANESHTSILGAALSQGLRVLYGKLSADESA